MNHSINNWNKIYSFICVKKILLFYDSSVFLKLQYIRKSDVLSTNLQGLHPVANKTAKPALEVADLLDRHTPILRPIRDSPPLPPIIPHPPSQPRIST